GDFVPGAGFLLARAARRGVSWVRVLGAGARAALAQHRWPGNVRELDNVMQRALVIHNGGTVEAEDLLFEAASGPRATPAPSYVSGDDDEDDEAAAHESLGEGLKDRERRLILDALTEGRGSRKYASEKLGISPRTLRYKISRMRDEGIAVPGH
ncbi:MAG: helix-turn-helix domain-containing protein, partial [Gammaproteobacteria bacterium]